MAVILALSCTGGSIRALPTPLPETPPAAPTLDGRSGSGTLPPQFDFSHVMQVHELLIVHYFRPLDSQALSTNAWKGVKALSRERGIEVPSDFEPSFAGDDAANRESLTHALELVLGQAGERTNVSEPALSAIWGMTGSLEDGHTGFVSRTGSVSRFQLSGTTVDLGYLGILQPDGRELVWVVEESSAAARAGLRPGDIIVSSESDGDPFVEGSTISLLVDRKGQGLLNIVAKTESRNIKVTASTEAGVAYIRLSEFWSNRLWTDKPYREPIDDVLFSAFRRLERHAPKGWVIDLRNNPGGILLNGSLLASLLGFRGVFSETQYRDERVELTTTVDLGYEPTRNRPLVVLVNSETASTAEVVVAALQDAGLAYVIGTRTMGDLKASVVFRVGDGALLISIGQTLAGPRRRNLDGVGVVPDETVPLDRAALYAGRDNQVEAALAYILRVRGER